MSLKDTVLKVLQETHENEGFISGQDLAMKCGVTRTSVWKAVEALRRQGANVEAVTNRGYRLLAENLFSKETVEQYLNCNGAEICFYDIIDSTNTQAKRELADHEGATLHKRVYVAAEQTAGRGRLGRPFYSPNNSGIYLSIVYSNGSISQPALITASAAVGICRAIVKVFNVESKIKWVNDIYIAGKKAAGILTEGITDFETGIIESAIIGIGVNISTNENQPEGLLDIAGSITTVDADKKRSQLAAEIINQVLKILDGGETEIKKSMAEYKARSILIGKEIIVSPVINSSDNKYSCTVLDVTEDAKLVVRLSSGETRTLESGEVSIHSGYIAE